MPSARSSESEPVEIASTCIASFWPRRITAPLPNCFSICASAVSSAAALAAFAPFVFLAEAVFSAIVFSPFPSHLRGCAGHVTHRVCCLCPAAHARGCFRVRTRTRLLLAGALRKPFCIVLMIPRLCRASRAAAPGNSRTPAVSKSRACGEQVAHRVFFFPVSRTHAVVSGCAPSHGFCWPGPAPAVGKIAHRVCAFAQPRTHAVVSGCAPSHGFCWPGLLHLRWASRAPCLCLRPASHARGCFRVRALARLLLAGARGCAGQIARASVYLRLLYQKGRVKSKRMDEFFRTFIRFYCGFGAAGGSENPRHARNGAKKEECAMCETAARRE